MGRHARQVFCKGKHIFLEFEGDLFLHNHLLMRGRWRLSKGRLLFVPEGCWLALCVGRHTICNQNGQMLRHESSAEVAAALASLGPDVMAEPYPAAEIASALRGSDQPIGPTLLDQSRVCGMGNIAKSEALYLAQIDPRTPARDLREPAVRRLVEAMREVCRASYHKGGRWTCEVYQRGGQECRQCGEKIARIVQAGRSTYFCPTCQDQSPLFGG